MLDNYVNQLLGWDGRDAQKTLFPKNSSMCLNNQRCTNEYASLTPLWTDAPSILGFILGLCLRRDVAVSGYGLEDELQCYCNGFIVFVGSIWRDKFKFRIKVFAQWGFLELGFGIILGIF